MSITGRGLLMVYALVWIPPVVLWLAVYLGANLFNLFDIPASFMPPS